MTRWIRNRPERRHDVVAGLAAGVAGVVVGAGVFWLVRVLAARETLPGGDDRPRGDRADGGDERSHVRERASRAALEPPGRRTPPREGEG